MQLPKMRGSDWLSMGSGRLSFVHCSKDKAKEPRPEWSSMSKVLLYWDR